MQAGVDISLTPPSTLLQTCQWRSSCDACRRSVPARCAWTRRSTLSSSHVDTLWCARNVHHPCGSARYAEAWSKARSGPSCHNQHMLWLHRDLMCFFYCKKFIYFTFKAHLSVNFKRVNCPCSSNSHQSELSETFNLLYVVFFFFTFNSLNIYLHDQ